MKRTLLFLILGICLNVFLAAQQKGFNYQAIIRDGAGSVLKGTSVTMKVSVLTGEQTVYQETHKVITSQTGYISLVIGKGTALSGNFAQVTWNTLNQSLKVEVDKGYGFEQIATSELQSVPYAKYAEYVLSGGSEDVMNKLTALKKTNDSLTNCITELKGSIKANETAVGNLQEATSSFTEYQDLKDRKYQAIIPPTKGVAQVNITVNLSGVSKDNPIPAKLVYNGGNGEGFKSDIEITYQGSSSMQYPKKNFSIDLDKSIKFGNWVAQDSYHLKANWIDATQARNVCVGRLVDDVAATRPFHKQRPWRQEWNASYVGSSKDAMFDNGAKGHIDGFPIELYINNEYYGLYTWNLKIHRDNYCMDKSNNNHILLKAESHNNFYQYVSGEWEMKNPKRDGYTGEGGNIPSDIITTISKPLNWFNSVKNSDASFKSGFETYFDKDAMIDYFILLQAFNADDDVDKNLSMCTWDGKKWYFLWYDMDTNFGLYWNGGHLLPSDSDVFAETGPSGKNFWGKFYNAYKTETIARWNYLKTNALSYENVIGRFSEFMSQISQEAYERDFKKWPDIPSHKNCYTSLGQISKWYSERLTWMDGYFK